MAAQAGLGWRSEWEPSTRLGWVLGVRSRVRLRWVQCARLGWLSVWLAEGEKIQSNGPQLQAEMVDVVTMGNFQGVVG